MEDNQVIVIQDLGPVWPVSGTMAFIRCGYNASAVADNFLSAESHPYTQARFWRTAMLHGSCKRCFLPESAWWALPRPHAKQVQRSFVLRHTHFCIPAVIQLQCQPVLCLVRNVLPAHGNWDLHLVPIAGVPRDRPLECGLGQPCVTATCGGNHAIPAEQMRKRHRPYTAPLPSLCSVFQYSRSLQKHLGVHQLYKPLTGLMTSHCHLASGDKPQTSLLLTTSTHDQPATDDSAPVTK
jgi:hypothetical protein